MVEDVASGDSTFCGILAVAGVHLDDDPRDQAFLGRSPNGGELRDERTLPLVNGGLGAEPMVHSCTN